MSAASTALTPTLDSGWFKSGWTYLGVAPFALFFLTGFILVTVQIGTHGFPLVPSQIIGVTLLGGFSGLLGWVFLRNSCREQIWLTDETMRVRRTRLTWSQEFEMQTSQIKAFHLAASDCVFDIFVEKRDQTSTALVLGLRVKELETWQNTLRCYAPVIARE